MLASATNFIRTEHAKRSAQINYHGKYVQKSNVMNQTKWNDEIFFFYN